MYKCTYLSPLGEIILASDGAALTGLWFVDQKYACAGLGDAEDNDSLPIFRHSVEWLDAYFKGEKLPDMPPLSPGGTEFQRKVWEELEKVPCGQLKSYGEIAAAIGCKSARAVGAAVGRNPISIFIPCHRVLGRSGRLTGYAGGLERKNYLLELEHKT